MPIELTAEEIAADLAAEDAQRSADRKLLAEVLDWSRRNGYYKAREYEEGRFAGYSWKAPGQKLFFCPHFDPTFYWEGRAFQPGTIREAVDVLCALGVLPPERFSSAFAAGRESAYTTDEWRVNNGGLMWGQSEIRSEAEKLLAASRDGWLEHRRKGATDWKRCDV